MAFFGIIFICPIHSRPNNRSLSRGKLLIMWITLCITHVTGLTAFSGAERPDLLGFNIFVTILSKQMHLLANASKPVTAVLSAMNNFYVFMHCAPLEDS